MKLTKQDLVQIIKEELDSMLDEKCPPGHKCPTYITSGEGEEAPLSDEEKARRARIDAEIAARERAKQDKLKARCAERWDPRACAGLRRDQ